jgi:hypothetical protein
MNGNRIAGVEPKRNCGFELPLRRSSLRDCQDRRSMAALEVWVRRFGIALGFGSAHAFISASLILCLVSAVSADVLPVLVPTSHKPDNTISPHPLSLEIRNELPCTLRRNSPVQFCESKDLTQEQIYRNALRFPSLALSLSALGEIGKQLLARIPIGLPAGLISSILAATFYSRLLERHSPKKGLRCRSTPWPQQKRIALETLLLGVSIGALLAIAEVSIRALLK